MSRVIGVILALLVSASVGLPVPSRALPLDAGHRQALLALVDPIEKCVANHDTDNPAFHGCFDWHSAVHANLALRIVARHSGEARYRGLADRVLTNDAIAEEHRRLREGSLSAELPYGYAWLLLLDREAGRADTHAMAADAARAVSSWLERNVDESAAALATRYANSSFAVFALHAWYGHFAPERGRRFAAAMAPRLLAHRAAACSKTPRRSGFLDPCASLLLALSQLASDTFVERGALSEMADTVARHAPLRFAQLDSIFEAGLNFSRAWALYAAARATGDGALVEHADQLFAAQLEQPQMWRQGYAEYSHWVAQFGVFALDLRSEIDDRPPAPPPTAPPASPPPPPIPLPRPAGPPAPQPIAAAGAKRVAPGAWAW